MDSITSLRKNIKQEIMKFQNLFKKFTLRKFKTTKARIEPYVENFKKKRQMKDE